MDKTREKLKKIVESYWKDIVLEKKGKIPDRFVYEAEDDECRIRAELVVTKK